jgi:diguanylate cyclase (GGDEF)-like protein
MSFRARLTGLFVGIVLLTMVGFGVLAFWLIGNFVSSRSKAQADVYAGTLATEYGRARGRATGAVGRIADDPALQDAIRRGDVAATTREVRRLRASERLVRVRVTWHGRPLADVGSRDAIAPALHRIRFRGGKTADVAASRETAQNLASLLESSRAGVTVTRDGRSLARHRADDTSRGNASFSAPDFAGTRLGVRVDVPAGQSSIGSARGLAIGLLVGFLVLALFFAFIVSRALQEQVARFLEAARRLASGDFSQPVPVEGSDDFAKLGAEFNVMASELERRLAELEQERGRLRQSIQRIGASFAANLDRATLLELGVQTVVDGTGAGGGRATVLGPDEQLVEAARAGSVWDNVQPLARAETEAVRTHQPAVDEQSLVESLAGQAAVSLENVQLHEQVRRQAVTDELTGLSNHRRFQEALSDELDRTRRFEQPVGLLMLDLDNFKRVNDTYGHPQGDEVLRAVARVLRETSRDVDEPARYGGEEMAVILPQTDADGAYLAGERVRTAVEALQIPMLDGPGHLRVTASLGVACGTEVSKSELIAAADRALYEAKHSGKNRTVRGSLDATGEPVDVRPAG